MAYKHGVSISESATSVAAPVTSLAGLPVVFGTAPVNRSTLTAAPVNVPVLCYSLPEAVQAFGYSDDWTKYTLCEMMDSHFRQYALSPVVLVNVLDPSSHKTAVTPALKDVIDRTVMLTEEGILLNTVTVKSQDGTTTYNKNTDYVIGFNDDGHVLITAKSTIPTNTTKLSIGYTKLDPSAVDAADIIGGVDANGKTTGLELLNEVFSRFGLVPGLVLAPGFSSDPTVASVMTAKAGNINGIFKALALTDLPTDDVDWYLDAPKWKTDNAFTSNRQVALWPKVKLGDNFYHYSTQLAGIIGAADAANGGIPFASPSNKPLKAGGLALEDGSEVVLGLEQANYLNSQGITTALSFNGSMRSWGNYTGAYPSVTDPKDSYIAVRRMFDWIGNSTILTYWQHVDAPTNKRLIETVVDSLNIWINGLVSAGALLGGRLEFRTEDNPTANLLAGSVRFRLFITPPIPAQSLEFALEYDTSYLAALAA